MCGRYNLIDSPEVQQLLQQLQITGGAVRHAADIAPGARISIVRQVAQEVIISDATWWLLLKRDSLKPDYRYASFNTRSDKLDRPGTAGYVPFRESRCIIPASAFVEGLGDKRTYFRIALRDQAIAFGGLYRSYLNPETGESALGASIITLPPLPQWQHIHPKSMPLMLPLDQPALLQAWLDPQVNDVTRFSDVLQPALRVAQQVTPIERPSTWREIGEAFWIE